MNIKPEKIALMTKAVVATAHLIVAIGRAIARPLQDDALDNVTAKATEFTTAVADVAAEMED